MRRTRLQNETSTYQCDLNNAWNVHAWDVNNGFLYPSGLVTDTVKRAVDAYNEHTADLADYPEYSYSRFGGVS